MKKNDELTLNITGMSAEGNGVGKADGMAIFVPNCAIGDVLRVRIVKVLKNYCFGKVMEIIAPSKDRITPDCPVFSQCGGCCYRHISYEAECDIKWQRVDDCIKRIGKLDITPKPILADYSDNYRNKAQFPVGENLEVGFYALHSHRIIPCMSCALQPKEFEPIIKTIKQFLSLCNVSAYNEQTGKGLIRHIYLRKGQVTGEIMVCLVINGKTLPKEQGLVEQLIKINENIKSIVINENTQKSNVILGKTTRTIYGEDYITDILCGVKVRLSPLSFYQVNHNMATLLYEKAKEYAEPKDKTVLDLYCGAGTIGLSMASIAKEIIGVEIVPQAVEDAKINAELNGITNARFICASAPDSAKTLADEGVRPDVVILDPPRKGITPDLVKTVAQDFSPEKVVYVSCDPATLARDLQLFEQSGYKTVEVTPVDLFPRTSHVESVALHTRHEVSNH